MISTRYTLALLVFSVVILTSTAQDPEPVLPTKECHSIDFSEYFTRLGEEWIQPENGKNAEIYWGYGMRVDGQTSEKLVVIDTAQEASQYGMSSSSSGNGITIQDPYKSYKPTAYGPGIMLFKFETPVDLKSIEFVKKYESVRVSYKLKNNSWSPWYTYDKEGTGHFSKYFSDMDDISQIKVKFFDPAAVTKVEFCTYCSEQGGYSCSPPQDCSSYQCPANSSERPGTQCLDSFEDCDCDYSFVKNGDECVCEGGKTLINGVCKDCSSYQCPANSYVRPGTQCLDSFDNCDCDYGFVKKGGECVCEDGKTLINGVCTACQVPHTPPASCSLFGHLIVFHTYYPVGTILEVKYAGGYKSLPVTSSHQHYVREPAYLSYHGQPFNLRMTNSCGSSDWQICKNYTPIGLDIAKTGKVGHISGSFEIDITGDGEINVLNEWFAPDVGILISTKHDVVDGNISGLHLFGDQGKTYSDGFAKLDLHHDMDGDDIIFGEELDGLAIWTDANSNAKLDDGELSQLSDHGIVALMSSHEDFKAKALLSDGSTILMEDLFFTR